MQQPIAETTDDSEDKDEVDEDGEEDDSIDEDTGEDNGDRKNHPSSCLIARTITLQMLMADGLLEPGEGAMSIEYMGQRFVGDLLSDGKIRSQETDIVFITPSAWAVNCRRIINPVKKSGCGWASIRYKGRKLDGLKNILINRRNEARKKLCEEANDYELGVDKEATMLAPPPPPPPPAPATTSSASPGTVTTTVAAMVTATSTAAATAATALTTATATTTALAAAAALLPKPYVRMPVKHHNIGNRTSMHDPNMLVECTAFSALGKIQPFLVSISTSALLVVDFHCHLTSSEVCGYLAGHWDVNGHNLTITTAFPCRSRLDDQANGQLVEKEIRKEIEQRGLIPVGWYHSHPVLPASPSLRDIDKQLDHEMHMKGSSDSCYTPCIGVICSPYFTDTSNVESSIVGYWVAPPPENKPLEYGKPMLMNYTIAQDAVLHPDVVKELTSLIEFYKEKHDFLDFNQVYKSDVTYLEKLKATLSPKFPQDQVDGSLWGYIRQLVTPGSEERDSDGNIKVYAPETSIPSTTTTATATTSTCSSSLMVPVQVGNKSLSCTSVSNSVNSNCHSAANSTSSTNCSSSGFFLGSDMTSAILAAGKLPAGTSLMSVLPGNNQNMFISPLGLNLLNNTTNKGCKTTCTSGSNVSNLATISSLNNLGNLSNLGSLGNLSISNLANLNNLTLSNISNLSNLSNLASISLSNKNLTGSNLHTNNFRNNSLSVSMTNSTCSHASHLSTTSSISQSLNSVASVSSSMSTPLCSVSSVKNSNNGQQTSNNDVLKKVDSITCMASTNFVKEDTVLGTNNSAGNASPVNNLSSMNNSTSVNSTSDLNGSKASNDSPSESDAERPAKIPKLDGTSVVTR
ncbi:MPN domain-containing protein-like isoform X2 [Thrips palmi]|nr:MPN domain-containing protein-like isoform X2 [Thrips palmi]XP_034230936.1 MPN domain-containing protein-like isoform X2 [Thrips palmi]XP_034230937.1 MPN domain-containing protein-like isoform X2 [Thrips palmi]